jgi:S-adenosylmethionine-diacylglycerol 3-amino-3-carboxypropyl transferase
VSAQGAITAPSRLADEPSVARLTMSCWRNDRLYFAQVREDPLLEMEALRPTAADTTVVVGSGGCTALSLLAGGGRVIAVDNNATQNHLIELKVAAVRLLPPRDAVAFLGGASESSALRMSSYAVLRSSLTPPARAYWDAHPDDVREGVIASGVTEGFIRLLVRVLEACVHPRARIDRLLACTTLVEQRVFYARAWDSWRWRAFFRLLLARRSFARVYDPASLRYARSSSFSEHFLRLAEHALTQLPVANNYFLHQMLTGRYPAAVAGGVPPYLSERGAAALATGVSSLSVVDGTYTEYLRSCSDRSVTGFALSNICEWLSPEEIDELFAEVVRVARPGARLCFRNFVGWTTVPARWRDVIVEDTEYGERLIARDRSLVQHRFVVCRVGEGER